MSERKVFLVSSGEWSDYGIHAAYSTRENAERAIAILCADPDDHDYYAIEEYDLDHDIDALGSNLKRMTVRLSSDLGESDIIERDASIGGRAVNVSETKDAWDDHNKRRAAFIFVTLWAKDEETAVKAAHEQAARWIAEGRPKR